MHIPAKTVKHAKTFFLYVLTAVMFCSLFPLQALAENRQPMDPSVMQPWMNSSIIGMVTENTTADCRDDYYLSVNHDWLLNTKLYPGYSSETGMLHKTMRDVRERCIALVTDKTLTGQDADLIQAYYELWLDWEVRNEAGLNPFLPAIEKLQAVETLDQMSEFLIRMTTFGRVLSLQTSM